LAVGKRALGCLEVSSDRRWWAAPRGPRTPWLEFRDGALVGVHGFGGGSSGLPYTRPPGHETHEQAVRPLAAWFGVEWQGRLPRLLARLIKLVEGHPAMAGFVVGGGEPAALSLALPGVVVRVADRTEWAMLDAHQQLARTGPVAGGVLVIVGPAAFLSPDLAIEVLVHEAVQVRVVVEGLPWDGPDHDRDLAAAHDRARALHRAAAQLYLARSWEIAAAQLVDPTPAAAAIGGAIVVPPGGSPAVLEWFFRLAGGAVEVGNGEWSEPVYDPLSRPPGELGGSARRRWSAYLEAGRAVVVEPPGFLDKVAIDETFPAMSGLGEWLFPGQLDLLRGGLGLVYRAWAGFGRPVWPVGAWGRIAIRLASLQTATSGWARTGTVPALHLGMWQVAASAGLSPYGPHRQAWYELADRLEGLVETWTSRVQPGDRRGRVEGAALATLLLLPVNTVPGYRSFFVGLSDLGFPTDFYDPFYDPSGRHRGPDATAHARFEQELGDYLHDEQRLATTNAAGQRVPPELLPELRRAWAARQAAVPTIVASLATRPPVRRSSRSTRWVQYAATATLDRRLPAELHTDVLAAALDRNKTYTAPRAVREILAAHARLLGGRVAINDPLLSYDQIPSVPGAALTERRLVEILRQLEASDRRRRTGPADRLWSWLTGHPT
jgi:hypothetical protein